MCTVTLFWRAWYNGSYTMMAKLIIALQLLHYPKIQFLVIVNLSSPGVTSTPETLTMSEPSQMISTFSHHAIMITIEN